MNKIDILTKIMTDKNYSEGEIKSVLLNLNPDWITFNQTEDEIKQQFIGAYEIWRGLNQALSNYIHYVELESNFKYRI
jgi:hypothetical protein